MTTTNTVSAQETPTDFSWALKYIKEGYKAKRSGWNGKDQWVGITEVTATASPVLFIKTPTPYIFMKTTTGETVPWTASQTDILATDWTVEPIGIARLT